MGLLRRVIIGDELTDKEKQALKRTLTDLASVIPIGFLMLLPVSFWSIIFLLIELTNFWCIWCNTWCHLLSQNGTYLDLLDECIEFLFYIFMLQCVFKFSCQHFSCVYQLIFFSFYVMWFIFCTVGENLSVQAWFMIFYKKNSSTNW